MLILFRVEDSLPKRRGSCFIKFVFLLIYNHCVINQLLFVCQCRAYLLLHLKSLQILYRATRIQKCLARLCSFTVRIDVGIWAVVLEELQLVGWFGGELLASNTLILLEMAGMLVWQIFLRRLLAIKRVRAILALLQLLWEAARLRDLGMNREKVWWVVALAMLVSFLI